MPLSPSALRSLCVPWGPWSIQGAGLGMGDALGTQDGGTWAQGARAGGWQRQKPYCCGEKGFLCRAELGLVSNSPADLL